LKADGLRSGSLAALLLGAASALAGAGESSTPPASSSTPTVVVEARKLAVEEKIDRKVYSVTEDVQSTFGTLSDILTAIPSIDVDPDGVVSLRGDSNVLILIDGKPSTLFQGSAAGDNLQSIPAKDIERIEVLTTPPAQFKAEGAAGVINIITRKQHRARGSSGTLQGSLGNDGRSVVAAGGQYVGERFTAGLNAGYRQDYRQRFVQSEVTGADPGTGEVLTSRDSITEHIHRSVPSVALSGEYDPNARQSLTASAGWNRRGGLRTYTQLDDSTDPAGVAQSSTRRLSSGHDPEDSYDMALRFTQKLRTPGETLDISLHRSVSHQYEHYDYVNDSFVPPAPTFYTNLSFHEDHAITEADADYVLPLSATRVLKLGYGFEQDDYGFANAGASVDPSTGTETIDPAQTNDFSFWQRIHAIYLSYQASAGSWSWLVGLRTELTTNESRQITDNLSYPGQYLRAYPSLHVDRSLSEQATLSFGASRRVSRPDPSNLNPYIDYEYTPNLRAGNPNLKPQFTQSYEAGYEYQGHGASYALTGYYRHNTDSVTDVTEYLGNGVSLTTKTNLPRNDSAGVEFLAAGNLSPRLSYSLSGNAFYTEIDATALGIPGLKSTTGINAKTKIDYRPTVDDSVQLSVTRTDKRLTPQGEISAINIVNFGYKHTLTRALVAVATVTDLFNGQHYQRVAVTPSFTQVYERSVAGRIAYLGVVYSFGVTQQAKEPAFEYAPGE
jgi:outer membrane receptor protein involved in Fe transport